MALTPAVGPSHSATGRAAREVFVQPSHRDVPVPSILSLPSYSYFSELLNEWHLLCVSYGKQESYGACNHLIYRGSTQKKIIAVFPPLFP